MIMRSLEYITINELVENLNEDGQSVDAEMVNECLVMWNKVSFGDAEHWGGLTLLPLDVVLGVLDKFVPELLEWDFSDGEEFPGFQYFHNEGDNTKFVALEEPVLEDNQGV
jgi:hypothetical protein